jgi:hypothetical protein
MSTSGPIGRHTTYFEEPDILYLQLVGPVSEAEGLEINRRHREFGRDKKQLFFLVDLKDLESIHPDVRRDTGSVVKELALRGAALYNASLKAKVFAKLILTAANLFRREEDRMPIVFFDTEAEARAWLTERREELARGRAA